MRAYGVVALIGVAACGGGQFTTYDLFGAGMEAGGVEGGVEAAVVDPADADSGDSSLDSSPGVDAGGSAVDAGDELAVASDAMVVDAADAQPPATCDRNNPAWRQHMDGWGETFYDCEIGITAGLALDACGAHFGAANCQGGFACSLPPSYPDTSMFVCGVNLAADPDAGWEAAASICWGYSGSESGVSGGTAYAFLNPSAAFTCPHTLQCPTSRGGCPTGQYQ